MQPPSFHTGNLWLWRWVQAENEASVHLKGFVTPMFLLKKWKEIGNNLQEWMKLFAFCLNTLRRDEFGVEMRWKPRVGFSASAHRSQKQFANVLQKIQCWSFEVLKTQKPRCSFALCFCNWLNRFENFPHWSFCLEIIIMFIYLFIFIKFSEVSPFLSFFKFIWMCGCSSGNKQNWSRL